jgi:hypothetical protein
MTTPEDAEHPPPGARLTEELRLLLDALAERAQPMLNRLAAADTEEGEHTPATCGWCPLCAGMAVLRGERPELAVRAAEHVAGLVAVLRAVLAERAPAGSSPSGSPASSGSSASSSSSDERVQHITVRRRDGEND